MKYHLLLCIILILLLTGCGEFSFLVGTPFPSETPQTVQPPSSSLVVEQIPIISPISPVPVKLSLWLPPQFDPDADTPAGETFQSQLNEFIKRRGVILEVRIKAVGGAGGMMDSLTTASAAAPQSLPDLVVLPRDVMETAALKGLLHSFDNRTTSLDAEDWYDYSRELARIQDSLYGLPFAGDAILLTYRTELVPQPPHDWSTTLIGKWPLVFPASDPQAFFTVAMYQASQGEVQDEQDRPFIDPLVLSEVLTFFSGARAVGVMPDSLTQYQSDKQVWEEFMEHRADLVVVWSSQYLQDKPDQSNITPIPTPSGEPYTLATGWVWALVTRQNNHYEMAVELAEFLTESNFLAKWTSETGYLPVRSSALVGWRDTSLQTSLDQIALSAHLFPSADILSGIKTLLQQATVQVLLGQNDPFSAAQAAAAGLVNP